MDNSTTIASGWMALVISTAMIAAGCGVRRPSTVPKCHHGRTLLASVALSVLAIPAWAQVRITDSNIPFLYESRAAVRTPDHKLAAIISTDYRNADDEFTRHDLFRQLKPVIESRLSQAAQDARVYLLIGARLGDYDFDRSAFPTGMSESTFIRFAENLFSVLGHYGYQVRFDNSDQITFVPVPPERARSFASALRRSREVSFRVEGQISRVAEDESKIVYMNVTKIVISLKRNQREIVSYEIPRRSPDEQSAAPPSSTPPAPPVERIAPTFDYTPPANSHPGSANVTFAVVGSRSLTSMRWTLGLSRH